MRASLPKAARTVSLYRLALAAAGYIKRSESKESSRINFPGLLLGRDNSRVISRRRSSRSNFPTSSSTEKEERYFAKRSKQAAASCC